ncbi:MAG: PrsW family intramembrane metalloprotease, partial [Clostridia bacterium]|nr:PrsW family intramembrane metalloprotease [Clostridia bacterium]
MIILLAAAVLPAVYLLFRVYRMDTIEKEPFSLLRKLLLWGAISGVPAALVESLLTGVLVNLFDEGTVLYNLFAGFVVAALVEESFKFFVLYQITFRSPDFNYRFDGGVYAVFVSKGVAIQENILYVFQGGIGVA